MTTYRAIPVGRKKIRRVRCAYRFFNHATNLIRYAQRTLHGYMAVGLITVLCSSRTKLITA